MINFQDVTDWMTGDASPEVTAEIEAQLRDPNSVVSRHLARMADPLKHESDATDSLVDALIRPTRASVRFRLSAAPSTTAVESISPIVPSSGWIRRQGPALAAGVLVGASLMFLANRSSENPVGPDGEVLELHVDKSARPAAWKQIWADNVSDERPAKENVERLRDASGPKVKSIIDDLRSKKRPDHEILTILENSFETKRP